MKKKSISITLLCIVLLMSVSLTYAYSARSNLPSVHTLEFYRHLSLGFSGDLCASTAASTWTNIDNCDIELSNKGTSSGTITLGDSRNDVASADFSTIPGFSSDANGISAIPDTSYSNFDIFLNSTKTWYYGQSGKLDAGGILTHEFGHVVGLDDVYLVVSPVCTMYGYNTFLGSDISYDLRTLEADDKNGARYIDGKID